MVRHDTEVAHDATQDLGKDIGLQKSGVYSTDAVMQIEGSIPVEQDPSVHRNANCEFPVTRLARSARLRFKRIESTSSGQYSDTTPGLHNQGCSYRYNCTAF